MRREGRAISTLRERNRRRTRDELAATALGLFEEQGYGGTTVEQIATASGVSAATFFRYFATKEEVLFADEDESAADLVGRVAGRTDRAQRLVALKAPFAEYARSLSDGSVPRLTRLVMTTPELASRSLRMRLRWELDLARQFAREESAPVPSLQHTVLASTAVSCLTSALRHWDADRGHALTDRVREAFTLCEA